MPADTTTLAPTDAEIDHLLATHWPAVFAVTEAVIQWRLRHAVREAIAKWGAPAPASGETETCKCCGEGSARIRVHRECDTCTSVYAGVAEHRLQKSLAAPPVQEVRVPLTEKQISKLWSDAHNDTSDRMAHQVLVRLVETAHGITAAQKETQCAPTPSL